MLHDVMVGQPAADAIRPARDAVGHTQGQAAAAIGLGSRKRWLEYESGKRRMPAASWTLYLLLTDQHPTLRLVKRRKPVGAAIVNEANRKEIPGAGVLGTRPSLSPAPPANPSAQHRRGFADSLAI